MPAESAGMLATLKELELFQPFELAAPKTAGMLNELKQWFDYTCLHSAISVFTTSP